MESVAPSEGALLVIATLAANPPYSVCLIGLTTAPPNPTFLSTLAALVEPTFTGYARQAAALAGSEIVHPDGTTEYNGSVLTYAGTVPADFPVTITGVFAADAGGTKLLSVQALDTPVVLNSIADAISLVPRLRAAPDGTVNMDFTVLP